MDSNIVEELLQKATEDEQKSYEKVKVDKPIDLFFDLRHLLAVDTNDIDIKELRANKEQCLTALTRDNTQLIINKLWQLETRRVEDAVVAQLPSAQYLLPRSKPVPKPRPPTKWETYAKEKGIQKTKREKLVWDETEQKWKPRFGFRGVNQNNDWAIEVPHNSDPNVDYFAKRTDDKKERVAKNELQRLRNIARSQRVKIAGNSGVVPQLNQSREQLKKASVLAKQSTASVGRFTEALPDEKPPKDSGKKRKFEPNIGDLGKEKEKNLQIIENIMKKKPKLDVDKAVEPLVKPSKKKSPEKSRGGPKHRKGSKPSKGFDKKGPKNRNNDRNNNRNKPNDRQNKPKTNKSQSKFANKMKNKKSR